MAQDLLIFDVTSEFPPSADRLAELREAAVATRMEAERREAARDRGAVTVGRATHLGVMAGGAAAAGAMWLEFSTKHTLTTQDAVVEAVVWAIIAFILAGLAAYILIMGPYILITGFGGMHGSAAAKSAVPLEGDLEELDYDQHPEKCVRFLKLCQASEAVRRYQNRLVAMGRRPVVGEYEAAERWAGHRVDQRLREVATERAQQACARLNEVL